MTQRRTLESQCKQLVKEDGVPSLNRSVQLSRFIVCGFLYNFVVVFSQTQ